MADVGRAPRLIMATSPRAGASDQKRLPNVRAFELALRLPDRMMTPH
jgi:hypothetical protein